MAMSSYKTTRDAIAREIWPIINFLIIIGVAYFFFGDPKYSFWFVFLGTLVITGSVVWILDYCYERAFETSTLEQDLAAIKLSHSLFSEAVACTEATAADYPATWSQKVLEEFGEIEKTMASEKSEDVRRALVQRAGELATLRAYVAIPPGIEIQGNGAISEMVEWAVPSTAIERLKEYAINLRSNDLAVSRMTLWSLYKEKDEWSDYVDWYYHFMSRLGAGLLIGTVGVLVTALFAFREQQPLAAMVFGGMSGALLSVLMRLPSLVGHGDFWSFLYRILIRVGTGTTASVMGLGFFASGLITLSLTVSASDGKSQTIAQLITACEDAKCPIPATLILLALAMLLGFTERALTLFEEKVFPSSPTTPSAQTTPEPIMGVEVSGKDSVQVGKVLQLRADARFANKPGLTEITQKAYWFSQDQSVIQVSNTGLCTPLKAGSSVVEATYSGRSGSMSVQVYDGGNSEATLPNANGNRETKEKQQNDGVKVPELASSQTRETSDKETPPEPALNQER